MGEAAGRGRGGGGEGAGRGVVRTLSFAVELEHLEIWVFYYLHGSSGNFK